MLELVSPQVAVASSFISSVVTPTVVAMHVVDEADDATDDEEQEDQHARCEEDLEDLTAEQLQLMVRTLNNQIRRSAPPATKNARSAYPRKAAPLMALMVPIPSAPVAPIVARPAAVQTPPNPIQSLPT